MDDGYQRGRPVHTTTHARIAVPPPSNELLPNPITKGQKPLFPLPTVGDSPEHGLHSREKAGNPIATYCSPYPFAPMLFIVFSCFSDIFI